MSKLIFNWQQQIVSDNQQTNKRTNNQAFKYIFIICFRFLTLLFILHSSFFLHFADKSSSMSKTSTIYWIGKKLEIHWIAFIWWNQMRLQRIKRWWHKATVESISKQQIEWVSMAQCNRANRRNRTPYYCDEGIHCLRLSWKSKWHFKDFLTIESCITSAHFRIKRNHNHWYFLLDNKVDAFNVDALFPFPLRAWIIHYQRDFKSISQFHP